MFADETAVLTYCADVSLFCTHYYWLWLIFSLLISYGLNVVSHHCLGANPVFINNISPKHTEHD